MKTNFFGLLFALTILTLTSCNNEGVDEIPTSSAEDSIDKNSEMYLGSVYNGKSSSSDCSFEYEGAEGPEHWSMLCGDEWLDCDGNAQSPINIVTSSVIEDGDINNINTNYTNSTTDIINNGHTIQVNYDTGSYASLNNIDYDLLQFHFHTGSEHTIDSYRYPMEMHLVHQDPITKLLGVVGVFFEEGDENETLENILENVPENPNSRYTCKNVFDIRDLLPENLEFYTYNGSLTTPGCSEIVTWFVVKEPIAASHSQIAKFQKIMHKNYRPVQELNGRSVYTK